MSELASLLHDKCGVALSERTVTRYCTEVGYTYKKAVTLVDHKHDNVQVKSFCEQFIDAYSKDNLYCIDEAGFYVGDHPRKGRAKRGQRLAVGNGKSIRKTKFSLGMAISPNGIVATQIMTHNFKKPDFVKFFNDISLPTGAVILMDNLKAHHSKDVKAVFERKGYIALFTPPYSPRCNPIEKVFGTLKPLYRYRCSKLTSQKPEDFRDTFLRIVEEKRLTSFDSTYQNTLHFLNDTLVNIAINPSFCFIGYDVSSFVRLYKGDSTVSNMPAGHGVP